MIKSVVVVVRSSAVVCNYHASHVIETGTDRQTDIQSEIRPTLCVRGGGGGEEQVQR